MPCTQIGTFKRTPRKGSVCVAGSVHSLMTRSPLLKMVLAFLSESGKSSRVFAKNSVKKFESERMVGECELVVKLICGRNEVPLSPGC